MMQNPPSCHDDLQRFSPPPPPFFPLKTIVAEQNLWSWPLDMSPPSPQTAGFLTKESFFSTDTCLSDYWLMSSKQPNLVLVTILPKHLTHHCVEIYFYTFPVHHCENFNNYTATLCQESSVFHPQPVITFLLPTASSKTLY